jgi:hypothetical protein
VVIGEGLLILRRPSVVAENPGICGIAEIIGLRKGNEKGQANKGW